MLRMGDRITVTMKPFIPSNRFIWRLGSQHPLLRCVLATTNAQERSPWISFLWERKNRWARKEVPTSKYWDVLRDKVEEIQIEEALYLR